MCSTYHQTADCHGRPEKGPYCANYSSISPFAASPLSRQPRSSQSLLGRTRLLSNNKKSESSLTILASPVDKLAFTAGSLPFSVDWREKVDDKLYLFPRSTRLPLISDLYTSELAYLTALHSLLDLYIRPLLRLMKASSAINKGRKSEEADIDGKRISPMLAVLLTVVESVYDLSVGGLGEVFVRYVGLFQLYTDYGKWLRSAMCELEGNLSSMVKRLEDETKRKLKVNAEREREREQMQAREQARQSALLHVTDGGGARRRQAGGGGRRRPNCHRQPRQGVVRPGRHSEDGIEES